MALSSFGLRKARCGCAWLCCLLSFEAGWTRKIGCWRGCGTRLSIWRGHGTCCREPCCNRTGSASETSRSLTKMSQYCSLFFSGSLCHIGKASCPGSLASGNLGVFFASPPRGWTLEGLGLWSLPLQQLAVLGFSHLRCEGSVFSQNADAIPDVASTRLAIMKIWAEVHYRVLLGTYFASPDLGGCSSGG